MIGKIMKGRGFRGVLDYAFDIGKKAEKDKSAELLDTNMGGTNPRELAREFGFIRNVKPNIKNPVYHISLSFAHADADKVTNELIAQIAQEAMLQIGFDDNQFVLVRHHDTDHEHAHLIINRIKSTPPHTLVSDSDDRRRINKICRDLEEKYDLERVSSDKPAVKPPTKGELEKARRTGKSSARMLLQSLCEAAMHDTKSMSEYFLKLQAAGVTIAPTLQSDDTKLNGLVYRLANGQQMKGSDLGVKFTAKGLAKEGIDYEKARDFEIVKAVELLELKRREILGDMVSYKNARGTTIYKKNSYDKEAAFYERGDKTIVIADHDNEVVLAALKLTSSKFDAEPITVTGNDEFKARCMALALEHVILLKGMTQDEQSRTNEAASRQRALAAIEQFDVANEEHASEPLNEPRANGGSHAAAGTGDSANYREQHAENRTVDSTDERAERAVQPTTQAGTGNAESISARPASDGRSELPNKLDDAWSELSDELDSRYFSSQLISLANASADSEPQYSSTGAPDKPRTEGIAEFNQRSLKEAKSQLEAMGCKEFVIGIRDEAGKVPFETRIINEKNPLEKYFNFLKGKNAQGFHITIKPEGDHGLTFLDDIQPATIDEMISAGLEPAVTIETSPSVFQTWIKLAEGAIGEDIRREANKTLARKFKVDINATGDDSFGNLAGFTNRNPDYAYNNGKKYPFTKVKTATGKVASQAKELRETLSLQLTRTRERDALKAEVQQKADILKAKLNVIAKHRAQVSSSNPKDEYLNQAQRITQNDGKDTDYALMDFDIAKSMIDKGFSHDQIAEAMQAASPNLGERKAGQIDDYVTRTIETANRKYEAEKAEATAEYAIKHALDSQQNSPKMTF